MAIEFELKKVDRESHARLGRMVTPHGAVETPLFAPVGTQATVKTMTPRDLEELGTGLILANTYHLFLRPGAELIASQGGLHGFMGWDRPILTDSGGYQVFSLSHMRKVDDDGVTFRSHIDGSLHCFTPESVIASEELLGADIIMVLDECPDPLNRAYNEQALARTHAWAVRCKAAQKRPDQALFGIVQGGVFADLRADSARFLADLDFPGYAIGGLAVGETKEQMAATLDITCPLLPVDKPRYLMGVGTPEDILESVARGIDFFDCVLPTRIARNGAFLTHAGRLNIRNAEYAESPLPVEESCSCYTCRNFSRAYLRHLFKAKEVLGLRLATLHNLHFMLHFMEQIRESIASGNFIAFKNAFLAGFQISDQTARATNRQARIQRLSESTSQ
ncbi:MAG: tRNA guanosine(34) transglycosylase Tgt [Chloroflexota bacterium]|nr:tRNA guanosine(34) transglycosylase Tgt [Chloroflexota bacterium]